MKSQKFHLNQTGTIKNVSHGIIRQETHYLKILERVNIYAFFHHTYVWFDFYEHKFYNLNKRSKQFKCFQKLG